MNQSSPAAAAGTAARRDCTDTPRVRWLKRLGVAALCCLALLLTAWIFRRPLLVCAAQAWIVNDSPTNADAAVVLGGGLQYRTGFAADLYHAGKVKRILLPRCQLQPSEELGVTTPEFLSSRELLLRKGVPDSAIELIGKDATSTRDEAVAALDWLALHPGSTVVVPTDIFHTRRARWIFQKNLRGMDARIFVTAIEPREYQSTNWWTKEQGLVAFQNEVIKYGFYRWKY